MIEAVSIENFKCFDTFDLQLGSLTLLTGFNGAGKSSSLQPLLLMSQALRRPPLDTVLPLNGSLARLGSAGDVIAKSAGGTTRLGFSDTNGERVSWSFRADRELGRNELRLVDSAFSFEEGGELRWAPTASSPLLDRVRDLIFLGAVREPFGEAQPYPDTSLAIGDVGLDGRFAPYWFVRQADEDVGDDRMHPVDRRVTVRAQVGAWLAELFPGSAVNAEEIEGLSLAKTSFALGRSSEWRRPSNVGYGLSYAFPILVALVSAKPGQIFIVDSPEAHLHPRAQSAMGRLLAHFATAGLQIVVESHSDHLLSGVRLAVREKRIAAKNAVVHFFGGADDTSQNAHTRIHVDEDGGIDHWPAGFFDQALQDLMGLS